MLHLCLLQFLQSDEIWSWCFSEENNSISIHESSWPNEEDFLNYSKPKTSNLLEIAMKSIRSIRQTKTFEGIGLGKPVEKIKISTNKINLEALGFFIDDFSNASGCYNFIKHESTDDEIITEIIIKSD